MAAIARQDSIYPVRIYQTDEVSSPPVIDGLLSDEAWNAVEWAGDFQMFEPYDDRPPTLETKFKIIFDSDHLLPCYQQ